MLSDVVADEVLRRRKAAGLTHKDLAKRCEELGWPLTASAISNIETGRRQGPEKKRRREITVDELAILAQALDTTPTLLIAPLGRVDLVELAPGRKVPTDAAFRWLIGEFQWLHNVDREKGPWMATADPVIRTYLEHRDAWTKYVAAQVENDSAEAEAAWKRVQVQQKVMAENGWRIPPMPGDEETS